MKFALLALLSLLVACGTEPEPTPTPSAATALPECPNDGVMLYFYGCTGLLTTHVCNDARGVLHASGCVIHDSAGDLTATCVAVCP